MFQMGLGMMGATAPGGSFGQTMALGMSAGMRNVTAYQEAQTMKLLREAQIENYRATAAQNTLKAQREAQQRMDLERYISTLPPEEQAAARADPKNFMQQYMQQKYPEPTAASRNLDLLMKYRHSSEWANVPAEDRAIIEKALLPASTKIDIKNMDNNLPKGWHPVRLPDGTEIAAPYPGTNDWHTIRQSEHVLTSAHDALFQLKNMLEKVPEGMPLASYISRVFPGTKENRMLASAWADAIMQIKEKYKLGSLQSGEVELIRKMVDDPTAWNSWNIDAILPQIEIMLRRVEEEQKIFAPIFKASGTAAFPEYPQYPSASQAVDKAKQTMGNNGGNRPTNIGGLPVLGWE